MPERRRLMGMFNGLAEGIGEIAKLKLGKQLADESAAKAQANMQLDQELTNARTALNAINSPDYVEKVGPEAAKARWDDTISRLSLPARRRLNLTSDPNFGVMDSTPTERLGGLTKEVGTITDPDSAELSPTGLRSRAATMRIPTAIPSQMDTPGFGVQPPGGPATFQNPEFEDLLAQVQKQKEGLLAKEPTEASTDVQTGVQHFTTARQRNTPGFTGTQTALTPEQEIQKAGKTTAATAQATADVQNNPTNQQGAARGAGMVAGAQKRAELAAELASMGITGQQQTGALQLADDFEKASTDYFKIRDAFKQVQGLSRLNTGQADTGIIFNYMKALDPNSSVREGEAASVQNAASIPDRIREAYNKAITGEHLDPTVRADILGSIKSLYSSAASDQQDRVKTFTDRATQLRVPPSMVVREPSNPLTKDDSQLSVRERVRQRSGAH